MAKIFATFDSDGRPTGFWDTKYRNEPTGGIVESIEMVDREDNLHGPGRHSGVKDAIVHETKIDYIEITRDQYNEMIANPHTRAFVKGKVVEIKSNDPLFVSG